MSKSIEETKKEMRRLDKERRQEYVARYSQKRVTWACGKSSGHKSRAKKLGCMEHFTAWQWLDLCAADDFRCTYCHEVRPLEPHHIVELGKGGANTIDNLVPLCNCCHAYWHDNPDDISELWMADQQRVFESFAEGDRVKPNGFCYTRGLTYEGRMRQVGVVAQLFAPIFPAREVTRPLRGYIRSDRESERIGTKYHAAIYPTRCWRADAQNIVIVNDFGKPWREGISTALVHWLRTVKGVEVVVSETRVDLRDLKRVQKVK